MFSSNKTECIICFCTLKKSKPCKDPEYFTSVFDAFCHLLEINLIEPKMRWNFKQENIPFCQFCCSYVEKLKRHYDQLNLIQQEISEIVQVMKDKILTSGCVGNISNELEDGIDRVTYIRQQAVRDIQLVENPAKKNEITTPKEDTDVLFKIEINEDENNANTSSFFDNFKEDSEFQEEIEVYDPLKGSNNNIYIETSSIFYNNFSSGDMNSDSDVLLIESEANEERVPTSRSKSDIIILDGADNIHKCLHCERTFPKKLSLTLHSRTHFKLNKGTQKCDICSKTFRSTSHLNQHKKIHTEEKPYKCDTCEKCFALKERLARHKRTHTGEKPFECDVCGKCYNRQEHLVDHKRVHSGEKPYECPVCGACFARSTNLNEHKKIHSSDRPYKCDLCHKHYKGKRELNLHAFSHSSDEKPFKCEVCDKGFWRPYDLNRHRRKQKCEETLKI